MIDQVRVSGFVLGNMYSTFLALILKSSNPISFDEYRPISLCNVIYKISSKIIANRMRGVLSNSIAAEKCGFLKGRSIHDAVVVAQEAMHTIHEHKLEALIMNIDLHKAYASVDWSFIRLSLLKAGLSMVSIRWIMACICSVRYVFLINGLQLISSWLVVD